MLAESDWRPRWDAASPAYERKISTFARTHFTKIPGYGQDDLESELREVLWHCVQRYDPNEGATFNTFFWQSAKNRFADLVKAAFRKKRQANVHTESLDTEAVRYAIEQRLTSPAAEDYLEAVGAVQERFRSLPRRRQRQIMEELGDA